MNRKTNPWYNFALGGAIALCVLFIFGYVGWKRSQRTAAELRHAVQLRAAIRSSDLATWEVEH